MVSSSEIVVDRAMGGVAEYYATSNPQVLEGEDPFFRDMVVDEDVMSLIQATFSPRMEQPEI